MAFNNLNIQTDPVAFGDVCLTTTKDITVVFENQSGGSTINVSLSALAAPFSYVSGSAPFALVGNGATHNTVVRYTPTSAISSSTTIDVTHDALTCQNQAGSPYSLAVTGSGFSNIYALPQIANNPAGTMKIDLIVDTSLPKLTIPSGVKVKRMGEVLELIDVQSGVVDVQNMDIELAEDYTTYTEGFWYHVIQAYPTKDVQFRFILTESGTDTFYFWGRVYRTQTNLPEYYVSGSTVVRSVSLKLVSLIHSCQDFDMAPVLKEMSTHAAGNWLTIKNMLASIVKVVFSQTFSTAAVQLRNSDMKLNSFATDYSILDCYMVLKSAGGTRGYISPVKTLGGTISSSGVNITGAATTFVSDVTPGGWLVDPDWNAYPIATVTDDTHLTLGAVPVTALSGVTCQYNDYSNDVWWGTRFANPFDLLGAIAANFGWIIRYYFGQADGSYLGDGSDIHTFEILTRGQSFGDFIIAERGIKESNIICDSTSKAINIKATDSHQSNDTFGAGPFNDQTTGSAWAIATSPSRVLNVRTSEYLCPDPVLDYFGAGGAAQSFPINTGPQNAKYDLDLSLQFILPAFYQSGLNGFITYCDYRGIYIDTSVYPPANGFLWGVYTYVKYYNYKTAAWEMSLSMPRAVERYYNNRFSSNRKQFQRKYGSLKFSPSGGGTASQSNLKPMKRIQINDLISTSNYYATQISKDFMTNTATVLWIQE